MASDGGSINGDTPPPSNMASTIIPTAPIKPITDAKSIFYLTLLKKQIARQCSNIRTKPDRQRVSVWNKTLEMLNNCYGFMGYDQGRRGQTARFSHGRGQTIAFTRRCRPYILGTCRQGVRK
jgi:hypothetical protein